MVTQVILYQLSILWLDPLPYFYFYRPTQAEKRISFSEICTYLNSQSEENLLAWNNEDSMVSSRCRELGASLSEAKKLYMDLQYSFSDSCV